VHEYKEADVIAPWLKRGIKNVRMLHTHDPKVADTDAFAAVLRTANAVWFNGGRQWNIVDSYMNTLTYKEFHNVLSAGDVYNMKARKIEKPGTGASERRGGEGGEGG
jgi:cyanophycinase